MEMIPSTFILILGLCALLLSSWAVLKGLGFRLLNRPRKSVDEKQLGV
jgi:hypothetical protein